MKLSSFGKFYPHSVVERLSLVLMSVDMFKSQCYILPVNLLLERKARCFGTISLVADFKMGYCVVVYMS